MRWLLVALAACGSTSAAPVEPAPSIAVSAIATEALCATHGTVAARITDPTVRAYAPATRGDAAALAFRYVGPSAKVRELASGEARHQIGLKLRATDSCNVVYVMWRADKAKLEVSVKTNPGKHTHQQCGASGYTKVSGRGAPLTSFAGAHVLRAEIVGDTLTAWLDDRVAWQGELPRSARALVGPAGFRTDNVELELEEFRAAGGDGLRSCAPRESLDAD